MTPQADEPGEAGESHRAHGGWAVAGVSVFQRTAAGRGGCPHFGTSPEQSQDRAERPVSLRLREEIQEVLLWGDGELTSR